MIFFRVGGIMKRCTRVPGSVSFPLILGANEEISKVHSNFGHVEKNVE